MLPPAGLLCEWSTANAQLIERHVAIVIAVPHARFYASFVVRHEEMPAVVVFRCAMKTVDREVACRDGAVSEIDAATQPLHLREEVPMAIGIGVDVGKCR